MFTGKLTFNLGFPVIRFKTLAYWYVRFKQKFQKTDNHKTFIKQSNMAFFYQTNHCDFQINKAIKLEETETIRCDKSWITQRLKEWNSKTVQRHKNCHGMRHMHKLWNSTIITVKHITTFVRTIHISLTLKTNQTVLYFYRTVRTNIT